MAGKLAEAAFTSKSPEDIAVKMTVEAMKLSLRLDNGRSYLMGVKPENLTVEDCLEAFGFTRNGLGDTE